jgi:hypothetical protein
MSRIIALCLLFGVSVGCDRGAGYRRPEHRNIQAIGAPQISVGTNGLSHGNTGVGSVQDDRRDMPAWRGGELSAEAEPVTVVPLTPQHRVESGQIEKVQSNSVRINTDTGETLQLKLGSLTSVTLDGKPANLKSLPAGAEVRASFIETGDERVAESLDVQTNGKTKKVNE